MSYLSIDQLQKILTEQVFHYAKDSKKAAGRALGTLVEIIAFYTLKSWGLERNIAIERPLPEFGNSDITHNVEYSPHPSSLLKKSSFTQDMLPLTSKKIANNEMFYKLGSTRECIKSNVLLTRNLILRNSCTIYDNGENFINAYLDKFVDNYGYYSVFSLKRPPLLFLNASE